MSTEKQTDNTGPRSRMESHLLTIYTRTPLHVGSGASVDVIDLPVARERVTGFPIIPGSGLKGVLLQRGRELWGAGSADPQELPTSAKVLFGSEDKPSETEPSTKAGPAKNTIAYAGCLQIMEAKVIAFPVRSLAGCFAWVTCPTALRRFQRDTGSAFEFPSPSKDQVAAGADLVINGSAVLEEYCLATITDTIDANSALVKILVGICPDPLWKAHLPGRLAVLHDENFQHYTTTCTEVVQRIKLNPATRNVDGGALFTQENVPCETLFYSVITVLKPRRPNTSEDPAVLLNHLLPYNHSTLLQIGGDETTGHGICELSRQILPLPSMP